MRQIFGRSLAPIRALPAGTLLAPGMLVPRKPGGGIPTDAMQDVVFRRLARDVVPERILRWDDLRKGRTVSRRKICIVVGSRANYSTSNQ